MDSGQCREGAEGRGGAFEEANVRHLQQHVELLRGAPAVENLQVEMQRLMHDYLELKVQQGEHAAALQMNGRALYTTAVAFLSRELPEPVQ